MLSILSVRHHASVGLCLWPRIISMCIFVSLSQDGVLTKRLDGKSDATESLLLMSSYFTP